MDCPHCGEPFPDSVRWCPVCQGDVGFPNVRAARRAEEVETLAKREEAAVQSAESRGCRDKLEEFREAVKQSKAAISRHLGPLAKLISSDNELYATFYKQVGAGVRLPEDNEADGIRGAVDQALFPNYHQEILFAALTIDDRGLPAYGDYVMILKTSVIEDRATVFEGNSVYLLFDRDEQHVKLPEPGCRAVWEARDRLAAVKLEAKIDENTKAEDFPGLLLCPGGDPTEDDFIEVHIYGSLHRRGVEKVTGPKRTRKQDRVMLADLREKLERIGATLELTT